MLRAVGVVTAQRDGKNRLYALNPSELKTVHDWAKQFERLWAHQLDRVKARAERKAAERAVKAAAKVTKALPAPVPAEQYQQQEQ